jgi:hypothetical protein
MLSDGNGKYFSKSCYPAATIFKSISANPQAGMVGCGEYYYSGNYDSVPYEYNTHVDSGQLTCITGYGSFFCTPISTPVTYNHIYTSCVDLSTSSTSYDSRSSGYTYTLTW